MAVRNVNVNSNQMLDMNNSSGVFLFYKLWQCNMPKDTSAYKTPVLTGDKQCLTQLVVVYLLANAIIVVFGFVYP